MVAFALAFQYVIMTPLDDKTDRSKKVLFSLRQAFTVKDKYWKIIWDRGRTGVRARPWSGRWSEGEVMFLEVWGNGGNLRFYSPENQEISFLLQSDVHDRYDTLDVPSSILKVHVIRVDLQVIISYVP